MPSTLRIIVTGLLAQHPRLGGMTWHYLQYLVGLARLGHDVFYFEDSGEFPYTLDGGTSGTDWIAKDCDANVGYLAAVMGRFGLEAKWAYHFPLKSAWYGLSEGEREAVVHSADLLINVSGSLEHPGAYRRVPRLLYIDTDPVITQIKIALGQTGFTKRVEAHDVHFTYGEAPSQSVPATRMRWRPTRQPIVLSEWRPGTPRRESFTTVMSWISYEPLVYAGRTYGQKDMEFGHFLGLPAQVVPATMEVALSGIQHLKLATKESPLSGDRDSANGQADRTPKALLTRAGWRVVDAFEACGDLDSYRHYIESSKAEWSVAKHAYVQGQPGWFSERSACYLAAGRPVVVQDTGFTRVLPAGEGIVAFRTLPEAVAAIREVEADYERHAEAARAIAETWFDSDKVLPALIDAAMSSEAWPTDQARQETTATVYGRSRNREQPAAGSRQTPKHSTVAIVESGILEHPAVKAWAELRPGSVEPERIEILKRKADGAVYRLAGVGPEGSGVIAKRCRHERAVIERPIYEQILPRLPMATIGYFGCIEEEADGFCWLFLEDVGDQRYSPLVEKQRALAAQWLGIMHTAAESLRAEVPLPDRGPGHYLAYLHSAREATPHIPAISTLRPTDRTILGHIASLCEFLEASWDQVETYCDQMPRTLVHGDCLAKNVHIRTSAGELTIAPFDWGGAGWGLPATDLGQLGLPYHSVPRTKPDYATYLSVVQDHWPALDMQTVRQLANLGRLFWALKAISRGIPRFDDESAHIESMMCNFGVYQSVLADTIRAARWES